MNKLNAKFDEFNVFFLNPEVNFTSQDLFGLLQL